jgi:CDP-archaeol synthase
LIQINTRAFRIDDIFGGPSQSKSRLGSLGTRIKRCVSNTRRMKVKRKEDRRSAPMLGIADVTVAIERPGLPFGAAVPLFSPHFSRTATSFCGWPMRRFATGLTGGLFTTKKSDRPRRSTSGLVDLTMRQGDVGHRCDVMELGHAVVVLPSLLLIAVANGGPILVARMLGGRLAHPIDGGIVLRDGHPLLGPSKTWRGLVAAIVFAACTAVLVGLPWQAGALIGASAMAGDCLSSFVKRRLALEPSSMALGLDQVPESLLPAVVSTVFLPLGFDDIVAIVLVFSVGELAISRLFYAIGLRDRPY